MVRMDLPHRKRHTDILHTLEGMEKNIQFKYKVQNKIQAITYGADNTSSTQ